MNHDDRPTVHLVIQIPEAQRQRLLDLATEEGVEPLTLAALAFTNGLEHILAIKRIREDLSKAMRELGMNLN